MRPFPIVVGSLIFPALAGFEPFPDCEIVLQLTMLMESALMSIISLPHFQDVFIKYTIAFIFFVPSCWMTWALANLALFILPFITGVSAIVWLHSWLEAVQAISIFDIVFSLVYFSCLAASNLIFIATLIFPQFFRYRSVILALFFKRRRHLSTWWYSRRKKIPNLHRLVRNVLCIPGKFYIKIW
ncbi:hypothetical protein DFH09DRAFT_1379043 [Mycena vulgaris]|nr:hypothetical protein DFH09DRAFT_1379043 [Mycena vulgaris]